MSTLPIRGVLAAVILFTAATAAAQPRWSWPEQPENLQVLPEDLGGPRLRPS